MPLAQRLALRMLNQFERGDLGISLKRGEEMSGRALEAIVVPYDVERDDTPMARGPQGLVAHGFLDALRGAGREVHRTDLWNRVQNGGKAEVVAGLGRNVARAVASAQARQRFPLILSGGCLTAVGVVAGLQRLGRGVGGVGVVWIDAHGDFNTPESTPSGYWDGMALAAVCGRSLPEVYEPVELRPVHFRDVVHLAGRAFDPPEVEDIQRLNLAVVPPREICDETAFERIRRVAGGVDAKELYLHIDLDGLDPGDAPAVGNPVPGGPALDDVLRCLKRLGEVGQPGAMTLSAMSFDGLDEAQARTMVATCVRLVETFVR